MSTLSRRDFLKVLSSVTLSPFVRLAPEAQSETLARTRTRRVFLETVPIAGFYYYEGMDEEFYATLQVGDELELRREPDNPHDANAIAVYTQGGVKLGYVPRIKNPIPAAIADQDIAIGAQVYWTEDEPHEYPPVSICLYMILPK